MDQTLENGNTIENKDAEILINKGDECREKKDYEEAARFYEKAIENCEKDNFLQNESKIPENEIALEIVKIYHDDFIYRHTNFWNIVYKSLFAILGLLSLPYFIYNKVNYEILFIFPLLSIVISFFSMLLLESETIRMSLLKIKLNNLLEKDVSLSKISYLEDRIKPELIKRIRNKIKTKKNGKLSIYGKFIKKRVLKIEETGKLPIWENFIEKPITKSISLLYKLLIIISILEIYFIISKKIF